MSEPATPKQEESGSREHRLRPRPIVRPPVDPALAAMFGRPRGVEGSFDLLHSPDTGGSRQPTRSTPPPPPLAEAFGRQPGEEGVVLQRPADERPDERGDGLDGTADPLWASEDDPWRDPGSPAVLGQPALREDDRADDEATRPTGPLLSLPEVLFGRRVKPTALALLSVIALLIGAAGGVVGWAIATAGDTLTGELNIAEAEAAKERPAGSVAAIAQKVSPAVVSIEVEVGQSGGVGSGVVIDREGYILTNHHVVSQAVRADEAKLTVVFTDGTRVQGAIVGTDPRTDLAVLKVRVENPVVIQIGDSDSLAPGDRVMAIGSPFGLENTVTEGIVSALNRPVTAPGENGDPPVTYDAIQTDAAINPGNSGGALVDSTGALVGINSMIRTAGSTGEGGSIGLGFAIPVNQAIKISEALVRDGTVKHASLGVNAASVAANTSQGAQVRDVVPNGPAAKAGIAEGDVIVKVGDRRIRNAAELTVAVREHDIGQSVPVQVVRDGRQFTVDVTLGSD
ncbi:S1C family serine protease [Saccharomonospora glauca]|jgi:S1-C subfamily serine protease|uniref:Trypsin-like serine protease with C-terminal PDZ domain n=1 Tax=Saccharomonospora glauca K62 TaxID=928724 RepID=I1CY85_9PSEU|nr:trypsin-like peptidase domain-containing protein [Saccharomonospora glauca]EIE97659.1 trypsin-like serine protease with C-terminal PDZ domain [Saccharomonospora glauca K62]